MANDKVVIKKYANRRLYDTDRSAYITLDTLAGMIREGRDVEVIDAKTGDDITHQVLTQIIVEEEAGGEGLLPVGFLRQLISLYGGQAHGAVPNYLEAAMDAFKKQQAAMMGSLGGMGGMGGAGGFDPAAFTDMARRNMEMFQSAASAFSGGSGAAKAGKAKDAEGDDEVAALKAELAALKAKVDKL